MHNQPIAPIGLISLIPPGSPPSPSQSSPSKKAHPPTLKPSEYAQLAQRNQCTRRTAAHENSQSPPTTHPPEPPSKQTQNTPAKPSHNPHPGSGNNLADKNPLSHQRTHDSHTHKTQAPPHAYSRANAQTHDESGKNLECSHS